MQGYINIIYNFLRN